MGIFVSVVIILALIWFAIVSPGFRKTLLILAVVSAGAIAWFYQQSQERDRQYKASEQLRWTMIRLDQLSITQVQLQPSFFASSGRWMLTGLVVNNSPFMLEQLHFSVKMKDCEDKVTQQRCRIVGQTSTSTSLAVPSGQTRSFQTPDLQFHNLPKDIVTTCSAPLCDPIRLFEWNVTHIRAY